MRSPRFQFLPLVMWFFPLMFFTYQFILRLWPGLMMNQIMAQFSIDASSFGILAAFYYYGYSGMQIPVAVLLDRFGPRVIMVGFPFVCGIAMLLFTYTNNFYVAVFSRFLIGACSAAGFLTVSKVVSQWFKSEAYAGMIGFSFSVGLLGAIYGGKPLSILIATYAWQQVALVLAAVALFIALSAFLVLRSPTQKTKDSENEAMNFSVLFSSKLLWLIALSNLLMVGSLEGFADVWGIPYLMTAYHLTKSNAALIISCVFFGMLFGGPILAYLSKKFGNYHVISFCGLGIALLFSLLLSNLIHQSWLLSLLFFCVGIMCCYQVVVFAAGASLVSAQNLGITVAFLNCINMLGGSFFHTCIGKLMDSFWNGSLSSDGIRLYDLIAYKYALSIIPICALFGAIIIFMVGQRRKVQNYTTMTRSINLG